MNSPTTELLLDAAAGALRQDFGLSAQSNAQGPESEPVELPFIVTRKSEDVLNVTMNNVYPGWEQWFLIVTDAHWDNPHCRLDLFHRFHRQAIERKAGIIYPGDFFCAMQGKADKRADKSALRPEHQQGNYFDALVDTAAKDLEPYKSNILLLAPGNHESSILNRQETDLIGRLSEKLGVNRGGYAGYVRFMFSRGESNKISHPLFYFHGSGSGGGVMTQSLPDSIRRSIWVPDAKFIVQGHSHNEWLVTIRRLRLSESGRIYYDEQIHIMSTSLKDDFSLKGGWHMETGKPPKPIGSTWLRFYYDIHARSNVGYEITRAR